MIGGRRSMHLFSPNQIHSFTIVLLQGIDGEVAARMQLRRAAVL
jgi:hypothetical protein